MKNKIIYTIIIAAGVLLGFTLWTSNAGAGLPNPESFSPSSFDWQQNGENGEYVVKLIEGEVTESIEGKVLTDENCERDEAGLSRCNQKVLLANNVEIEFIMPHNMSKHRCLIPGETVKISPYREDGFVKANLL